MPCKSLRVMLRQGLIRTQVFSIALRAGSLQNNSIFRHISFELYCQFLWTIHDKFPIECMLHLCNNKFSWQFRSLWLRLDLNLRPLVYHWANMSLFLCCQVRLERSSFSWILWTYTVALEALESENKEKGRMIIEIKILHMRSFGYVALVFLQSYHHSTFTSVFCQICETNQWNQVLSLIFYCLFEPNSFSIGKRWGNKSFHRPNNSSAPRYHVAAPGSNPDCAWPLHALCILVSMHLNLIISNSPWFLNRKKNKKEPEFIF